MSEALASVSFETFLKLEAESETRHELVGGRMYDLAGASARHDLLAGLLYEFFAPRARAKGCRPFIFNRLVRTIRGNGYYPDVMVACGGNRDQFVETDPSLLIEVLSPSTLTVDRREKAIAYAEGPSLKQYLVVDPYYRRIEVMEPENGRAGTWVAYGPGQLVTTEFGIVVVDDLYDQLDGYGPLEHA